MWGYIKNYARKVFRRPSPPIPESSESLDRFLLTTTHVVNRLCELYSKLFEFNNDCLTVKALASCVFLRIMSTYFSGITIVFIGFCAIMSLPMISATFPNELAAVKAFVRVQVYHRINKAVISTSPHVTQSKLFILKSIQKSKVVYIFGKIGLLMNSLFTRIMNLYFDSLVKENYELSTKISVLESNNSDLNVLTADLTTKNRDLKSEMSHLSKENRDSKAEISRLKTTNSDLSMKISRFNTDIQEFKVANSKLVTENTQLVTENSKLVTENTKFQQEIEELKFQAIVIQPFPQSTMENNAIRFSQTLKHSQLRVSQGGRRVVVVGDGFTERNILGQNPLLPSDVYTWKLWYEGDTHYLIVGVIDESEFRVDDVCYENAHGRSSSGNTICGCLSGNGTQWDSREILEINANLINYTLTIRTVDNSSIYHSGTLPRLSSGNYYYPFARLAQSDHELEILE
ncbi:hypothetical protein GEMRC1_007480 [Eukaryota sp. GEM-RC1]